MTVCLVQLRFKGWWMDRNGENEPQDQLLLTCAALCGWPWRGQVFRQTKDPHLRSQINRVNQLGTAWHFVFFCVFFLGGHKANQIHQLFELYSVVQRLAASCLSVCGGDVPNAIERLMLLRVIWNEIQIHATIPASYVSSALSATIRSVIFFPFVIAPFGHLLFKSSVWQDEWLGPTENYMTGCGRSNHKRLTDISFSDRQQSEQKLPTGYGNEMQNISRPILHCSVRWLPASQLNRDTKNPPLIKENKQKILTTVL